MGTRILTVSKYAQHLGFSGASDPNFRQLKKTALKNGYIKIQQSGHPEGRLKRRTPIPKLLELYSKK